MAFTAALAAAGLGLGAYGRYRGGKSAKKAAKFEARQLEQRAGQVKAVSQRKPPPTTFEAQPRQAIFFAQVFLRNLAFSEQRANLFSFT